MTRKSCCEDNLSDWGEYGNNRSEMHCGATYREKPKQTKRFSCSRSAALQRHRGQSQSSGSHVGERRKNDTSERLNGSCHIQKRSDVSGSFGQLATAQQGLWAGSHRHGHRPTPARRPSEYRGPEPSHYLVVLHSDRFLYCILSLMRVMTGVERTESRL